MLQIDAIIHINVGCSNKCELFKQMQASRIAAGYCTGCRWLKRGQLRAGGPGGGAGPRGLDTMLSEVPSSRVSSDSCPWLPVPGQAGREQRGARSGRAHPCHQKCQPQARAGSLDRGREDGPALDVHGHPSASPGLCRGSTELARLGCSLLGKPSKIIPFLYARTGCFLGGAMEPGRVGKTLQNPPGVAGEPAACSRPPRGRQLSPGAWIWAQNNPAAIL